MWRGALNGSQVASGSYDNTVIIWDATTGDKVSELKGHSNRVLSVAWSAKGDKIVSGAGNPRTGGGPELIIWDATTGNKMSELKGHLKGVSSVAWSPQGSL